MWKGNQMHKIQRRILKLAKEVNITDLGYRKLGEKIDVDHPQQVKWHLSKLIADGHLQTTPDGQIIVMQDQPKLAKIPILGAANCGEPLIMAEDRVEDYLTLSPGLVKKLNQANIFAVRASGDSMNQANINGQSIDNGDYVIIDSAIQTPSNGDYVLASIEGLATIKRFIKDDERQVIALVAESTRARPPIIVAADEMNTFVVHGVVKNVIHTPSF
jgi:SOS-response transcriptional repressor LexA